MRILVTGFEPFGGEPINPSLEIVNRLPTSLGEISLRTASIPVEYARALPTLRTALASARPQALLMLGQAGGRFALTPERVAINLDDGRLADNAGERRIDRPIAPRGPAAYFSTLPVKAMAAAIRDQGVPAEVSNTAGTYLCNHLMYAALHHIAGRRLKCRAGFMHVPWLPAQVVAQRNQPALALDDMLAGVCAALVAIATHERDVEAVEGALH